MRVTDPEALQAETLALNTRLQELGDAMVQAAKLGDEKGVSQGYQEFKAAARRYKRVQKAITTGKGA